MLHFAIGVMVETINDKDGTVTPKIGNEVCGSDIATRRGSPP